MSDTMTAAPQREALSAATEALAGYAKAERRGRPGWDRPADAGPAILCALVADNVRGAAPPQAREALAAWLTEVRGGCTHFGLYSWGLSGVVLGLRTANRVWPTLGRLADTLRSELVERVATRPWLTAGIGWVDYDLVSGPAGVTLVLTGDPDCAEPDGRVAVDQMIGLCMRDDLAGLRVGQFRDEEYRGWNYGLVNAGVAHGVGGVALALCAARDSWGRRSAIDSTLARIACWLRTEAYSTSRHLITWHYGERRTNPPAARAQNAWCYGNPGIAWTLWEIGRILADDELQRFAEDAFASFLAHGKEYGTFDRHGFNICHGAAGEMMVCDAFHRYAHLTGAGCRRDELAQFVLAHRDHFVPWTAEDASLLSGTSGVLAALLTVHGGDRRWLAAFGLR